MTTFKLQKPEEEVRRVGFVLQKQGIHERIPAQVGLNMKSAGVAQLFRQTSPGHRTQQADARRQVEFLKHFGQ